MLSRYNPWQELNAIERQINSLFEDTRVPSTVFEKGFVRVPAAELQETEDALHLKLELPGLEAKGVTKTEFHYGKFQRVIPLPAQIQNTNVTADYKDGILNLTLPKTEQAKNKVVKVNLEQPAA